MAGGPESPGPQPQPAAGPEGGPFEARLEPLHPYDLGRTLAGLRMGSLDPSLRVEEQQARWALRSPEGPVALSIRQQAGALLVRGWGSGWSWIEARLDELLGLRDEPWRFQPEHPGVARLWRRHRDQHLPRLPQLFERTVAVVLLQRVTSLEAHRAWRRLLQHHGEPSPGPCRLRLPPGPEQLRRIPGHELVRLGVPPRQADTLQRLARAAPALERAGRNGAADLTRVLGALPGIGPWTVQYVLGSGLGFADAVLVGDDNLPHSVAWNLAGEPRADDARMLELLEPFRGHRYRVIRLLWTAGRPAPRRGPRHPLRTPRGDRIGGVR